MEGNEHNKILLTEAFLCGMLFKSLRAMVL